MKETYLCGKGKCCPSVKIGENDTLIIKTDDGNKVCLNKEQTYYLKKFLKKIK